MNWEEAKQKVAENEGYKDWKDMQSFVDIQFELDCVNEAAELWQQSNLERIKELEQVLKPLANFDFNIHNAGLRLSELQEHAKQLLK